MKSMNPLLAPKDTHEEWTPLLELAAREVFELMLSSQLAVPATAEDPVPEVTAMVGLAGQMCGVLSVRCDEQAAALMTSKMLGVALENVGPDVSDGLGEICNMVAGNFKNKIAGMAEGCILSPPTVVTGSDYTLHTQTYSLVLEVRLLFENEPVIISLQIRG